MKSYNILVAIRNISIIKIIKKPIKQLMKKHF
jgi:hypothetical protein